jgi:peptide/nickel transport system substrate-binding protein
VNNGSRFKKVAPPSFNALVSDTGYDALVMDMTLLGLTAVELDGNVYPVLAADLPTENNCGVVNNDDGSMDVTWTMRKDITWSDGQPVTADDALFTYRAMSNAATARHLVPGQRPGDRCG